MEVETAISIMQNAISGGVGFAHEKTGGRFYAHKMHHERPGVFNPAKALARGEAAAEAAPGTYESMA